MDSKWREYARLNFFVLDVLFTVPLFSLEVDLAVLKCGRYLYQMHIHPVKFHGYICMYAYM